MVIKLIEMQRITENGVYTCILEKNIIGRTTYQYFCKITVPNHNSFDYLNYAQNVGNERYLFNRFPLPCAGIPIVSYMDNNKKCHAFGFRVNNTYNDDIVIKACKILFDTLYFIFH